MYLFCLWMHLLTVWSKMAATASISRKSLRRRIRPIGEPDDVVVLTRNPADLTPHVIIEETFL